MPLETGYSPEANEQPPLAPPSDKSPPLAPRPGQTPPLAKAGPSDPPDYRQFFLWYGAAFLAVQFCWHASDYVRHLDFLELPLVMLYFPLASLLDPHDAMLNNNAIFFYAFAFWAAVVPIALRLTPHRINPLVTAFGIILSCGVGSMVYSLIAVAGGSGPVQTF